MKKLILLLSIFTLSFSNAQFQVDTSFPSNSKFNLAVKKIIKQNDGKTILIGDFTTYDTTTVVNRLARLNADGTLDTSFNIGTSVGTANPNVINDVLVLNDGKLLVAGFFNTFNGTATSNLIRLNSDGTLDNTFATNPFNYSNGQVGNVTCLATQQDGKILVGGQFDKHGTIDRNGIARLNADGTLDTTYDPGTGVSNSTAASQYVSKITPLSDGSILVGGRFDSFNSNTSRNGIAKTNANGSLHNSFTNGTNTDVTSIVVQPDGKVIIGGSFTLIGGTSRNRIARLNANGSIDNSFNIGTGANGWVHDIKLLPNNKILVAGAFTNFNGTAINNLIVLNPNGTLDTSFNPNSTQYNAIRSVHLENDGKLLIAGTFSNSGSSNPRNYFLRLYDPNYTLNTLESTQKDQDIKIYPNPTAQTLNIAGKNIQALKVYSPTGSLVLQSKQNTIDVSHLASGQYIVEVTTLGGISTHNFIKK